MSAELNSSRCAREAAFVHFSTRRSTFDLGIRSTHRRIPVVCAHASPVLPSAIFFTLEGRRGKKKAGAKARSGLFFFLFFFSEAKRRNKEKKAVNTRTGTEVVGDRRFPTRAIWFVPANLFPNPIACLFVRFNCDAQLRV